MSKWSNSCVSHSPNRCEPPSSERRTKREQTSKPPLPHGCPPTRCYHTTKSELRRAINAGRRLFHPRQRKNTKDMRKGAKRPPRCSNDPAGPQPVPPTPAGSRPLRWAPNGSTNPRWGRVTPLRPQCGQPAPLGIVSPRWGPSQVKRPRAGRLTPLGPTRGSKDPPRSRVPTKKIKKRIDHPTLSKLGLKPIPFVKIEANLHVFDNLGPPTSINSPLGERRENRHRHTERHTKKRTYAMEFDRL